MAGGDDEDQQPAGLPAILGEWGDLLHKIPGAAKAFTKLVGSTATAGSAWIDIGTAKGEQHAAEIRGVTDARKKVREAMTKAAVKQVGSDPDLGRRALEHFADEIVANQANREAVTEGALRILALDPPKEAPAAEISDDWLRAFSIYAERASSETLRAHWSSILAGEIRKPGSVSLMTINLMSIIDANGAALINKYKEYVLTVSTGMVLPTIGSFAQEPAWDEIVALDGMGFLRTGTHAIKDKFIQNGRYRMEMVGGETIGDNLYLQCSILTQAGRELVAIIGHESSLENAKYIRQSIVDAMPMINYNIFDNEDGTIISPASECKSAMLVLQEQMVEAASQAAAAQAAAQAELLRRSEPVSSAELQPQGTITSGG